MHAAHPPPTGDDVSSPEVGGSARLSFRLKTFTWEPEYDVLGWELSSKHGGCPTCFSSRLASGTCSTPCRGS